MYQAAKTMVRTFLPNKLFFHLEPKLRHLHYSLFYKGSNQKCSVCGKSLKSFIPYMEHEQICPNCGSLARDRKLWQILKANYISLTPKILDFSPSRSLYRKLKKLHDQGKVDYVTTDLSGNFLADKHYDITNIEEEDNTFDVIICYHVLEHVIEDALAMKELFRILKPNGTCLIQTPFKEGEIFEDYSITSPEKRLEYFGQEDHVRVYSVRGLKQRLLSCGFKVTVNTFEEKLDNIFGFSSSENVLVCRKPII